MKKKWSNAIRLEGTLGSGTVQNNTIIANVARRGVSAQNLDRMHCLGNNITNTYDWGAGVLAVGCDDSWIGSNCITGVGFYSRGIYNINSPGLLTCNTTIGSGTGITFSGGRYSVMDFAGNLMSINANFGLALRGKDINIGKQPNKGNKWNQWSPTVATRAINSGDFPGFSQFKVHTNHDIDLGTEYYPMDVTDDWFELDGGLNVPDPCFGAEEPCNMSFPEIPEVPDFPEVEECEEFTESDIDVATGLLEDLEYSEGNLWSAYKGLLEKIRIPCIGTPPVFPEIDDFEIEHENSDLGKLLNIEFGIKDLRVLSDEDEQILQIAMDNLENEQALLLDLEEQILDPELTEIEISNLTNQIETSVTQIATFINELELIRDAIKQERIEAAIQLYAENQEIVISSIPAANEKTVNAIYLQTLAVDTDEFTEEQLSEILSIASQCHNDGGDAVYRARALYAYPFPYIVFDDEECEQQVEGRNNSSIRTQKVDFVLKPNPATSVVQLNISNNSDFEGKIRISNLLGENIMEYEKPTNLNHLEMDVSKLSAGIYFVQVWNNEKLISSEKLSIVK